MTLMYSGHKGHGLLTWIGTSLLSLLGVACWTGSLGDMWGSPPPPPQRNTPENRVVNYRPASRGDHHSKSGLVFQHQLCWLRDKLCPLVERLLWDYSDQKCLSDIVRSESVWGTRLLLKTSQQRVEAPVFLAGPTLSIHGTPGEQEQINSHLKLVIYPFNDSKVYSFTFTFRSAGTVKSHWQWQNFNLYYSGDFIDKERPQQGMGWGLFKFSFTKEL